RNNRRGSRSVHRTRCGSLFLWGKVLILGGSSLKARRFSGTDGSGVFMGFQSPFATDDDPTRRLFRGNPPPGGSGERLRRYPFGKIGRASCRERVWIWRAGDA